MKTTKANSTSVKPVLSTLDSALASIHQAAIDTCEFKDPDVVARIMKLHANTIAVMRMIEQMVVEGMRYD